MGIPTLFNRMGVNANTAPPPVDEHDLLCFTATADNSSVALAVRYGTPPAVSLQYSKDKARWKTYTIGNKINLSENEKVYFRGNNVSFNSNEAAYNFVTSGAVDVDGNIMSLIDKTCESTTLAPYIFSYTFSDCASLNNAENLKLPSNALTSGCYRGMFNGCSGLLTAPTLSATSLEVNCYNGMFRGCASLSAAPELPATTLADSCYQSMFQGCTALTDAPTLSATTLAAASYREMFYGCSSLSSMNVAFTEWNNYSNSWAWQVAQNGVFTCKSTLPEIIGYSYIPEGWRVVHSDAVELPFYFEAGFVNPTSQANATIQLIYTGQLQGNDVGYEEQGEGWEEPQESIYHPAETHWDDELQEEVVDVEEWWEDMPPIYHEGETHWFSVYEVVDPYDLEYSTDLSSWQKLTFNPTSFDVATGTGWDGYYEEINLGNKSRVYLRGNNTAFYDEMGNRGYWFVNYGKAKAGGNIMSLLDKTMQQTTAPENCFREFFKNCGNLVSIENLKMPATDLGENCYREMFNGISALSTALETLPASSLNEYCYKEMFRKTSITETPILSATTLASGCYQVMFAGCSNLTGVTTCMTSWFAQGSYNYFDTSAWLSGVAPTGVFRCDVNKLNTSYIDDSHIPSGWTVVTTEKGLKIQSANFTFTTEAAEEKKIQVMSSEPYTLSLISGSLPNGVTFDTTNGKFTSTGNQNLSEEKTVVVTATSEHYTASAQFKCKVELNTTEVTSPTKLIFYGNDIARTRQIQYETINPITPVFYYNGVPNCIDADTTSGTLTSIPENITSDSTDYFNVRVYSSTGHTSPYFGRIDCIFKAESPAPLDYVMYAPMISKDQYDFTNAHQLTYSSWVSPDQIDNVDCMYFDYSDYVKVENMTPQSVGTSGTWSIWFNGSTIDNIFNAKGNVNDTSQARIFVDNGDLHVYFTSNQGHLQAIGEISSNTWYNIVFTYNGSEAKLYVNGVLKDSISTALCPTGDGTYFIAGRDSTHMAAARIYDRVLTDAEITQLASEFTPTT